MTISDREKRSSIRFRPRERAIGDCMPFYHNGEYHIFYLLNNSGNEDINWEHAVSADLVNWRELPPAIRQDPSDPHGPEGGCMFTGSIIVRDDLFHAFYTSWNPLNPAGREFICHATSSDLVTWTKHPEDMIAPDGIHYADRQARDFRDPCVVWNEDRGLYEMFILANPPAGERAWVFGRLTSADLTEWEQHDALEGVGGDECPDLFRSGDTYFLHGNRFYLSVTDPHEGWHSAERRVLDRAMAAKRTFDGRRHVWFGGWLGGPMTVARVVAEGPQGTLSMRPAEEVVAAFDQVHVREDEVHVSSDHPWSWSVPQNYLLEGQFQVDEDASLSLVVRDTDGSGNSNVVFSPRESTINATGGERPESREVPLERIFSLQAFIVDGVAEVFVDSRVAATFLVHDVGGELGMEASGPVTCRSMSVRTMSG